MESNFTCETQPVTEAWQDADRTVLHTAEKCGNQYFLREHGMTAASISTFFNKKTGVEHRKTKRRISP